MYTDRSEDLALTNATLVTALCVPFLQTSVQGLELREKQPQCASGTRPLLNANMLTEDVY